ncbi:MAG: MotA/TolQ/ExbB proton channel family protein, partial [Eggerthellaceae bacterium]|nr:MotA/TolQ/ExbB proton channel family protein [Eggerthellaceae bacterium]
MSAFASSPIGDVLHVFSQGLLVPTVLVLLVLAAYAVYTLGSFVVEMVVERRAYRVEMPELIARIDAASFTELGDVIDGCGLLDTQRACLQQLVDYAYLPPDALTEVAKRALAGEAERYEKALGATEAAVKIAPMLGLMGTLIPLGPGITGLSAG